MTAVLQSYVEQNSSTMHGLSRERQHQLELILDYSHQMLDLAGKRQWEALQELELTRQQLLIELCSGTVLPREAHHVALVIREVLDIDSQVIEHVVAGRTTMLQGLQDLYTGRRARLAYTENSS